MSDPLSFLYMSVASVLGDKSNFLLARIQKALSDFFADEGRERTVYRITTKSGPLSARQRNVK